MATLTSLIASALAETYRVMVDGCNLAACRRYERREIAGGGDGK